MLLIRGLCQLNTMDKFPPGSVCPSFPPVPAPLGSLGSAIPIQGMTPNRASAALQSRIPLAGDLSCPLTPFRAQPVPSPGKTGYSPGRRRQQDEDQPPGLPQGWDFAACCCVLMFSQLDLGCAAPAEVEMLLEENHSPTEAESSMLGVVSHSIPPPARLELHWCKSCLDFCGTQCKDLIPPLHGPCLDAQTHPAPN